MPDSSSSIAGKGVLALPEAEWHEAKRRAEVIAPLAKLHGVSHKTADAAALALGLSRRTIYTLIRRWRHGEGVVTDLARAPKKGGKGRLLLSEEKEQTITDALADVFLSRQRRSVSVRMREVRRQSRAAGVHPPAMNTVIKRIHALDPESVIRRRHGEDAARNLRPVVGVTPTVSGPLDVVQIDHTVIDLMIVDSNTRQVIGRPYLTIAIDEFSRCVVGMVIPPPNKAARK